MASRLNYDHTAPAQEQALETPKQKWSQIPDVDSDCRSGGGVRRNFPSIFILYLSFLFSTIHFSPPSPPLLYQDKTLPNDNLYRLTQINSV
jgi:hypothetical protein